MRQENAGRPAERPAIPAPTTSGASNARDPALPDIGIGCAENDQGERSQKKSDKRISDAADENFGRRSSRMIKATTRHRTMPA